MLNLIKAELYRTFRRKYTLVLLLGGAACAILVPLLFVSMRVTGVIAPETSASELVPICLAPLCTFAYFGICMLVDCVFSDEYKHTTLKNTVSYGVTRTRIYFAKLAAELVLALLEMVAVVGVFCVSCYLFLGTGTPEAFELGLRLSLQKVAQVFPIWLAGLAIANVFYFLTRGSAAVLGYLGVTLFIPVVISQFLTQAYVWAQKLVPYLMFTHIGTRPDFPEFRLDIPWIIGPVWMAVAVFAGFVLFRRKEIK